MTIEVLKIETKRSSNTMYQNFNEISKILVLMFLPWK